MGLITCCFLLAAVDAPELCIVSAAKNVVLAGVKAVTVHDTADVRLQDLSAQFYLTEASIGDNRAAACKDKLQELNTAVLVTSSKAELSEQFISQFQV